MIFVKMGEKFTRKMARSPRNFSWIIVNEIAGCANIDSEWEYLWLKEQGIKHILSLNHKVRIQNALVISVFCAWQTYYGIIS